MLSTYPTLSRVSDPLNLVHVYASGKITRWAMAETTKIGSDDDCRVVVYHFANEALSHIFNLGRNGRTLSDTRSRTPKARLEESESADGALGTA